MLIIIYVIFFINDTAVFGAEFKPLKVTLQASEITLDPGGIQDSQSLFISRQINCQLFRNEGATYVYDAAESVKYQSPTRLLLKISDHAVFYDGSQVTARDVVSSLNYIAKRRHIVRNLFSWIRDVEVVNDKTIAFNLLHPTPQFLRVLSSTNYTIYKSSFLNKAMHNNLLWNFPEGCGGYRIEKFNNELIQLSPVRGGLPVQFYFNKNNEINASELGDYDIVTLPVVGDIRKNTKYKAIRILDPLEYYIGLNTNAISWRSKEKRCNFLSSLNLNNLVQAYGPGAKEASDLIPTGVLGHQDAKRNDDKLEKSTIKKISGKNDEHRFCMSYLTLSVREKMKKNYIDLVRPYFSKSYLEGIDNVKAFGRKFSKTDCDAIVFGWRSNYWDGYEFLTVYQDNDANFSGIKDYELSKQIKNSQNILEPEKRVVAYRSIIDKISELCIVKPLFEVPMKVMVVKKDIRTPGIGLMPFHLYYLGNVTRD